MTLRSATVLLLAALSCVFAGFAGWREAEREPPCTLALPAGGDLQKAVDGIATNGPSATVCLGEGEFRLERFVAIDRDGVSLRGRGASTILRLREGTASPVIVAGDYAHATPQREIANVTIENLRIVGGGAGGSEFQTGHPYLTNSAIVVRAGRQIAIRHVDVTACRSACILTEQESRDVAIEGNEISGSVWDGISLNRTTRARLVGNTIRTNTAAGITTEHLEDSLIEDNVVIGNGTHGIYLSDSYGNRIDRNRFSKNVISGVFVTCAVHDRDPVLCWSDSMSGDNVFEKNALIGNRVAYMVGADDAANCSKPTFTANLSRGDLFLQNPNETPEAAAYGRCMRYL